MNDIVKLLSYLIYYFLKGVSIQTQTSKLKMSGNSISLRNFSQ